uniref:Uncharacterized protein n=1 Tax=Anguilla anguilla TaxID=7936 RepID=A0A0E9RFA4_ANGAN
MCWSTEPKQANYQNCFIVQILQTAQ